MAFSIKCGDIIRLSKVSYTDHPKYHLVLCASENLFFIINSHINNSKHFYYNHLDCQVSLAKNPNHSFMQKEISYIDCSQIADEVFSIEVEKMINSGTAEICGSIDNSTIQKIIYAVDKYARFILPRKDLAIILKNLNEMLIS